MNESEENSLCPASTMHSGCFIEALPSRYEALGVRARPLVEESSEPMSHLKSAARQQSEVVGIWFREIRRSPRALWGY